MRQHEDALDPRKNFLKINKGLAHTPAYSTTQPAFYENRADLQPSGKASFRDPGSGQ